MAGDPRGARRAGESITDPSEWQAANDFILNIEILRALGVYRRYLALVRLARRKFPADPIVQLYYARMLQTRGMHIQGINYLLDLEQTLGRTHRAWWGTQLASIYGDAGFAASCERILEEVKSEPDFDSPLALYSRSSAYDGIQKWHEAADLAAACVEAAPRWSRARAHLINCLLARGDVRRALEHLEASSKLNDAQLDVGAAMLDLSLGHFEVSRQHLQQILGNWPEAHFRPWIERTLYVVLVESGATAAARELAERDGIELGLKTIAADDVKAAHRFIPIPLVAQTRDQCVPTSVAMAAFPHGRRFDPDELYKEMHGRGGTALWRMREFLEGEGLRVMPVQLSTEAIIEVLEHRLPLIGIIEGPTHSHVDVISGYHAGLEAFYVRDPMHWAPVVYPFDVALRRYELHGGVLAIVPQEQVEARETASKWSGAECQALLDLSEAVANGEHQEAELAFQQIPDDSIVAFMRDAHALHVVISDTQYGQRMRETAYSKDANPIAQFRALMSLHADDAEEALEKILEDADQKVGNRGRLFVTLQRQYGKGEWQQALKSVERLLLFAGGSPDFWRQKSDILAELGDHQGSLEALSRAIELAPDQVSLRQKAVAHSVNQVTLSEYVDEFRQIVESDPHEKRLLWGLAQALRDSPDGKEYERTILEYLKWYPRDGRAYAELISWYLSQNRNDLADRTHAVARDLLPDEFVADDQSPKTDPTKLPEDNAALLQLIFDPADPRWQEAVQKLASPERHQTLKWHEQAQLVANQLVFGDSGSPPTAFEAMELTPDPTPGPAHWFANSVASICGDFALDSQVAGVVVQWIAKVTPDYRNYANLWFNRVLMQEQAGQVERALVELADLNKKYPGYCPAAYRMGVLKYQQADYAASLACFEQALQINPGHFGALRYVQEIESHLGRQAESRAYLQRLRKLMPYHFDLLRDEAWLLFDLGDAEAAERLIDTASGDHQQARCDVLRAQIRIQNAEPDQLDQLTSFLQINEEELADDGCFEDWLNLQIELATRQADARRVAELCEQGLQRWPDSSRLREIQADSLSASDLEQSQALLREALLGPYPTTSITYRYLNSKVGRKAQLQAAQEIVDAAAGEQQQNLIELFGEVVELAEFVSWNCDFWEWILTRSPDSDVTRWRLANQYNLMGKTNRAVELARELYRRQPQNPQAAGMLGRCLIERNAREAITLLEKACEQNRSTEVLFDLARANQLVGNSAESIRLHWDVLQKDPFQAASLTNLTLLKEPAGQLWPFVNPMLKKGSGGDDEYFLVAAVMLAVATRGQAAPEWIGLAKRRLEVLKTRPGFHDEKTRLKQAVFAWRSVRSDSGPFLKPLRMFWALCSWPGIKWIPRQGAG